MSHSSSKTQTAVIIGAGPAGLTAAIELLRHTNIRPIVIEQEQVVGGIARTVNANGNRMDIGGHRFFSKSEQIMNWWTQVLPLQDAPALDEILIGKEHTYTSTSPQADPQTTDKVMLVRNRISHIFYRYQMFKYPVELSIDTLRKMGFTATMRVAAGYAWAKLFPRKETSLQDFYINRFGEPLYKMFFENYTRKVWGKSPKDLDADWGNQRINTLSLTSILKSLLKKTVKNDNDIAQRGVEKSLIERFLYPKYGPGQLWQIVAQEIINLGGEIIMQAKVDRITIDPNSQVQSVSYTCLDTGATHTLPCNYALSSMPIKHLIRAIDGINVPSNVQEVAMNLPYRDFITIGVLVDKLNLSNNSDIATYANRIPDTWIYIQQPGVKIGRLQIFNNWSPYMVADYKNSIWLGLEYFCSKGDDLWVKTDEQLATLAANELKQIGIISPDTAISYYHVERVPKAYPAYFGSYHQLPTVTTWLDSIKNLYCIGRNGQHRYNNMDHSMMTAIEAVKNIKNNATSNSNIWAVNTDDSYHESTTSSAHSTTQ
ncbi:MAG: NAD(P)/FAD-dependent oxidoreductase [Muribaculaceae bacterium]